MDTFTCEVCQQELSLEEQSFDMEGACETCAEEESSQFQCCVCGNNFPSEECGSCDDICTDCDEE